MILGIGTDLCGVDRIARAIENERFLLRLYTPSERTRLETMCPARRSESAAGLFAAKEAVAKALGTGFTGFGFADIEITPDSLGRPSCALHGGAIERLRAMGGGRVHVSITHDQGMALAFAVIETP